MTSQTKASPLAFADRPPFPNEIERLRLVMSTFQDGSGQVVKKIPDISFPDGWDFEACISAVFGGKRLPKYDKSVFDVLIPYPAKGTDAYYGLSCKMRGELKKAYKRVGRGTNGRVTMELTNANRELWEAVKKHSVTDKNIGRGDNPAKAGSALLEKVGQWHDYAKQKDHVMLAKSSYLVLLWQPIPLTFKLYQFSLNLPDPTELRWFRPKTKNNRPGAHIKGVGKEGTIFEWYFSSGGQLKYYPSADDARWQSDEFTLEPLSKGIQEGLLSKVEQYFPDQWGATFPSSPKLKTTEQGPS